MIQIRIKSFIGLVGLSSTVGRCYYVVYQRRVLFSVPLCLSQDHDRPTQKATNCECSIEAGGKKSNCSTILYIAMKNYPHV